MVASDEIYKNAIESSKDLIFWADRYGNVKFSNKSFLVFFKTQKNFDNTLIYDIERCSYFCKNINIKNIDKFFQQKGSWELFFDSLIDVPSLYETVYKNFDNNLTPVEFYASRPTGTNLALIVAKDITERRRFEFKIKEVTNELIKNNKNLQEFAYISSHDLKEPLRKISMFSNKLIEKLQKDPFVDSECNILLKKIHSSSVRMQDMVDSILEYSRIGSSDDVFCFFNIEDVIVEAIENCEASIKDNKVYLNIDKFKYKNVFGDKKQILQLFQNLISNSVKFKKNEEDLIIKIGHLEEENKRCVFFVEDNGIGIREEYCEKIFLPFQKLHSKSKYAGHGMGLSICKKIIERHNGKIVAKSVENKWTRIEFDLQVSGEGN